MFVFCASFSPDGQQSTAQRRRRADRASEEATRNPFQTPLLTVIRAGEPSTKQRKPFTCDKKRFTFFRAEERSIWRGKGQRADFSAHVDALPRGFAAVGQQMGGEDGSAGESDHIRHAARLFPTPQPTSFEEQARALSEPTGRNRLPCQSNLAVRYS